MRRIPEPELMDGKEQSLAYANADFEQPNSQFMAFLTHRIGPNFQGSILDLGCGPGDIALSVAKAFPNAAIDAVDGSQTMLEYARHNLNGQSQRLQAQIRFVEAIIPQDSLPRDRYHLIISNSLLHHLHNPQDFWQTVNRYRDDNTFILVMDLFRPDTLAEASKLVETYAKGEPEILRQDFYHSLCAAFTRQEIEIQLREAGLEQLMVSKVSDRHVLIESANI